VTQGRPKSVATAGSVEQKNLTEKAAAPASQSSLPGGLTASGHPSGVIRPQGHHNSRLVFVCLGLRSDVDPGCWRINFEIT
jgi:hypothetical protein